MRPRTLTFHQECCLKSGDELEIGVRCETQNLILYFKDYIKDSDLYANHTKTTKTYKDKLHMKLSHTAVSYSCLHV